VPLRGRPRDAGGHETRFHRVGQDGVGDTRWRSGDRDRFHERPHVFIQREGMTPGVQDIDRSADKAAPGTIRRLWKQTVNFIPAGPQLSHTLNHVTSTPTVLAAPLTVATRYRASTVFRGAGSTNTRFGAPRPIITPRHNQPRITLAGGNLQGRPTSRNRLTSFGSRVPPVNK
jgi:hypothetical protein